MCPRTFKKNRRTNMSSWESGVLGGGVGGYSEGAEAVDPEAWGVFAVVSLAAFRRAQIKERQTPNCFLELMSPDVN